VQGDTFESFRWEAIANRCHPVHGRAKADASRHFLPHQRLCPDTSNTFPSEHVNLLRQARRPRPAMNNPPTSTAQKRKRSTSPSTLEPNAPQIFRSQPIQDRDSTFIGLFSPTLKPQALQTLPEISGASHKILAFRRESNQQSITKAKQYTTGHDDDGEKYGGSKVEKVLVNMAVEGACVVARWYGGTMLGPVRFTHMEEAARGAVRAWQEYGVEERARKRRVEEEGREKEKLVKVLAERDRSIVVLRALAAEKEQKVKAVSGFLGKQAADVVAVPVIVDATANGSSPKKEDPGSTSGMDYVSMPVERLRSLEKARDATLGFLLKRIDEAEASLSTDTSPASKADAPG